MTENYVDKTRPWWSRKLGRAYTEELNERLKTNLQHKNRSTDCAIVWAFLLETGQEESEVYELMLLLSQLEQLDINYDAAGVKPNLRNDNGRSRYEQAVDGQYETARQVILKEVEKVLKGEFTTYFGG